MGKFLVFVIGFSIASFVLSDILGPNSTLFGGNDTTIGTIKGEDVDYNSFQSLFEEFSYNFSINNGTPPTSEDLVVIREQVWEKLIQDISFVNEYDNLGLEITDLELVDMVQGKNVHPLVQQAFTDPEVGIFDVEQVVIFLKNLSNQPSQQQQTWSSFERNLIPIRLRNKYDNLISKTTYLNTLESKREYFNANQAISLSYLHIPYYSINDSLVSISQNELQSYLKKNKNEYFEEESRSIKYVIFNVNPSSEDSLSIKNEINRLKNILSNSTNDSIFSSINSDGFNAYLSLKKDQLDNIFGEYSVKGNMIGPIIENDKYVLYKFSDISSEKKYSARAQHILLKWNNLDLNSKVKVRIEANRILNLIKKGSNFQEMARMYSEDGSATNGGDLGWFSEGQMVKPFEEAVFSKTRPGLINRIVESEFGFHIINVISKKTNKIFKVSKIEKDIVPSDMTRNLSYRNAEIFRSENSDLEDFLASSNTTGLKIFSHNTIDKNDQKLGSLNNSRSLIMWLYSEENIGKLSSVIELDNSYVIAVLTDINQEGTSKLEDVENSIKRKVINNKKFDLINKDLIDLKGSLEEISESYGDKANIYSMDNLLFNFNSLNNVGYAPNAVGISFSMDEGEITKPFFTDDGVVILQINSKEILSPLDNYSSFSEQLLQANKLASPLKLDKAIKEFSDIKDYRYKFF